MVVFWGNVSLKGGNWEWWELETGGYFERQGGLCGIFGGSRLLRLGNFGKVGKRPGLRSRKGPNKKKNLNLLFCKELKYGKLY